MTLKKVKASDVIGSKYYTYHLSSSNYTPSLNGTVTITCTVYNIYDETVSNKSVTLYQNGTSKGAKTTNGNGVCTWSITCSSGGLQKFNVNDTSIEVYVDNKSEIGHTHSQYLTEHQSLKTINSQSLIGSGNIDVSPTIDSDWVSNSTNPVQSKVIKSALDNKLDKAHTSYKGKNVVTNASTGTIEFEDKNNHTHSQYLTSHQDITGKEDTSNKLTSLQSLNDLSTDTQYPSAKLVYTYWSDLDDRLQNNYPLSSNLGAVAFSNDYEDLDSLPSLGNLAFENDVDLSGHDLDELSDNTNLLFSGDYDDLDNKPTIPTQTSQLTNNSGFITSSSLSNYLQQSDVKDNLTSTDANKPLSANQGKELKTLIDSKEDNIEIFTGSVDRTSSTSAFLKAYTTSSIIEGKIILYKVPNISSIEWTTNVALDYYRNNQTTTFNRKYVYKNGVQLTFGDIESNSWLLLAYEGTLLNGQWNLISSSSYVETKKLPTSTSDLTGDYLQTQQGNEVFGVSNNAIDYGNQALTLNTLTNKFYYNKLEGSGEIATIYDLNKTIIKNFSNNETIINKQYNTSKEVKFHYSRTNTTDCDGYIQIGDDDYGIIVGVVETESTSRITLQDNSSGDMWSYSLSDLDDSNSFDVSLRLELDTQDIESLQLGDTFRYYLILTLDGTIEEIYSAEVTITQSDNVDIFLNRNYISKVVQDTNARITDLTYSTDNVYVEKSDLNNNSTSLDSLFADMIDYGMDNDSEW